MVDLAPIAIRKSLLFFEPLVHIFICKANQNSVSHDYSEYRNPIYLCKWDIEAKLICKYISPYQSFQ